MSIKKFSSQSYEVTDLHTAVASVESLLLKDGFVVVEDDNGYRGLLTVKDLLRNPHLLVADCLTDKPGVKVNDTVQSTFKIMEDGGFSFLPVFDGEDFWGVVSHKSIALHTCLNHDQFKELETHHLSEIAHLDALRTMAGGIVHDVNNQLTSSMYCIDTVLAGGAIGGRNATLLEQALVALQKASSLAKDLMVYSRPDTIKRKPTDLPKLLEAVAESAPGRGNVDISLSFPDSFPLIEADPIQLERVMSNLVFNAIEAGKNKPLRIAVTGSVHSSSGMPEQKQSNAAAVISITDNGAGIPENLLGRIFEPYYTNKPYGNGLGLAIVHNIISNHGGHIDVKSQLGKGTTFDVWLPCSKTS